MTQRPWPFDAPPNEVAITARGIVERGGPVLLVARDSADGGWQFLSGEAFVVADSLLVTLQSIFDRDPTLGEVADLPVGWEASRTHAGGPWKRVRSKEQ